MSTAVWMVMCSEPVMRAPASGLLAPRTRARIAIRPGISCSASWISLRPHSASERSFTRCSSSGPGPPAGGFLFAGDGLVFFLGSCGMRAVGFGLAEG